MQSSSILDLILTFVSSANAGPSADSTDKKVDAAKIDDEAGPSGDVDAEEGDGAVGDGSEGMAISSLYITV